eukprot:TRINITY_DN20862_c0_g1_i1.p1 TRINITY_DN20862_c0_g1~~TRINITY_DN20862_c0_g1_i1.p1  ORF type:complete len:428 (+),score=55.26 TRINITY_DN20862_c0_g1_i1:42-1286(+)
MSRYSRSCSRQRVSELEQWQRSQGVRRPPRRDYDSRSASRRPDLAYSEGHSRSQVVLRPAGHERSRSRDSRRDLRHYPDFRHYPADRDCIPEPRRTRRHVAADVWEEDLLPASPEGRAFPPEAPQPRRRRRRVARGDDALPRDRSPAPNDARASLQHSGDRGGSRQDARQDRKTESSKSRLQKEYMQRMAAAQKEAWKWAMMGHPGAMHAAMMQQHMMSQMGHPPGMPSNMLGDAESSSSSSGEGSDGESSSSDSSEGDVNPEGTRWPVPPPLKDTLPDAVEAFLAHAQGLDPDVAGRMRAAAPRIQQEVMRRGPLDARSPTSMLLMRLQNAIALDKTGALKQGVHVPQGGIRPIKQSAKAAIEAMISEYRLNPGVQWTLRSLPPDKQKLAAKIDPSGQADPSGYVADELQQIV